MSRDLTKPTKWLCAQRRLRSAWSVFAVRMKKAWVLSYPWSTHRRLIRLGRCPGWSESSLGAQSLCWFSHVAAHMLCVYIYIYIQIAHLSNDKIICPLTDNLSFGNFLWPINELQLVLYQHRGRSPSLRAVHKPWCPLLRLLLLLVHWTTTFLACLTGIFASLTSARKCLTQGC